MTSEERQQQIKTLVERLRELDLEKRAMNLVLQGLWIAQWVLYLLHNLHFGFQYE